MTDMIFMGQRHDDNHIAILLFIGARLKTDDKYAIHHFIKQCLQKYIDTLKV